MFLEEHVTQLLLLSLVECVLTPITTAIAFGSMPLFGVSGSYASFSNTTVDTAGCLLPKDTDASIENSAINAIPTERPVMIGVTSLSVDGTILPKDETTS